MKITHKQQVECVKREITMRAKVYPGLVGRGKMTKEEMDYEVHAMTAVYDSLCGELADTLADAILTAIEKKEVKFHNAKLNDIVRMALCEER